MIKEVKSNAERAELVKVLRDSFATVAEQYNLTEVNAPTNPAFVTMERLAEYLRKPVELLGLFIEERMIGCIAIEPSKGKADVYYIERLAVVPQERHHGYGDSLLSYALDRIKQRGGRIASIGIIDENHQLKEWYQKKGFIEIGRKRFNHLPFEVCFMLKEIEGVAPK
jgi:ribosomal protein S18 acetylase RimI-like enzyme